MPDFDEEKDKVDDQQQGITNRPAAEELREQEKLPPRGKARKVSEARPRPE